MQLYKSTSSTVNKCILILVVCHAVATVKLSGRVSFDFYFLTTWRRDATALLDLGHRRWASQFTDKRDITTFILFNRSALWIAPCLYPTSLPNKILSKQHKKSGRDRSMVIDSPIPMITINTGRGFHAV